jgi:hypothetical protein
VPVAYFFPWGHSQIFCTVPTWHTKNSDYFCLSNFHSLEKTYFCHLLTIKDLQNMCACLRGDKFVTYVMNLQGPFTPGTLIVWGAQ